MRIGYVLPNSWGLGDPRDDVELAVLAEALGVDSLWVSHHVIHAGFVGERLGTGNYYDPLISLAAAALATTTPRLGTSVLVLGYLDPLTTAKQLATIDWLSRGRVDAGGFGLTADAAAAHCRMLRGRLAAAGRATEDFPFQVRLHVDAGRLEAATWRDTARAYAEAGLTDLILAPQTRDKDAHLRWLETLLPVLTSATQT